MEELISKLETEKVELDTKISNLDSFIMSASFNIIDKVQQELLGDQFDAMTEYSRILEKRISNLKQ